MGAISLQQIADGYLLKAILIEVKHWVVNCVVLIHDQILRLRPQNDRATDGC